MKTRIALVLVPLALGLAACGGDDSSSDSTAAATSPPPATTTTQAAAPASSDDIAVTASEYAFDPSTLSAPAGKVKLTLKNGGKIEHELVVLRTDAPADSLPDQGGRVSEDASVGEVSEVAAGQTKSATLDLKPGRYVIVCNIAGHYGLGMRGTLTVK